MAGCRRPDGFRPRSSLRTGCRCPRTTAPGSRSWTTRSSITATARAASTATSAAVPTRFPRNSSRRCGPGTRPTWGAATSSSFPPGMTAGATSPITSARRRSRRSSRTPLNVQGPASLQGSRGADFDEAGLGRDVLAAHADTTVETLEKKYGPPSREALLDPRPRRSRQKAWRDRGARKAKVAKQFEPGRVRAVRTSPPPLGRRRRAKG